MSSSDQPSKFYKPFVWTIISVGFLCLITTLYFFDYSSISLGYILFCLTTVVFASRIVVQIPRVKGHISVSDTFVFLSLFLFGGEAGIILSTIDGSISSYKLSKKVSTLLFNISNFTISAFVNVWILRYFFGPLTDIAIGEFNSEIIVVVCLLGLIQYVVNSGIISTAVALRSGNSVWQMWRDNFLWTSITYFAGASAAGIIANLIYIFGFYAFLTSVPIAAVVYFTYTTYLKNVDTAAQKAELAQKHIEELSHHIAEQERISRALKESEEYFRNAFDHAAGMALIDPAGKWLQVNESLCEMLGYTEEELLEKGFQAITHPQDLGNDLINLNKLLEGAIPNYQLEKRYCHKSGVTIWVLQSASLVRDAEGNSRHVIFQIQNISDRKRAEEQIRHAAFHDDLTDLPNRTLFADRLSMSIERAKRTCDHKFAVIFVDLDRFKVVNDSLGHDMGDKLLVELSMRLLDCVRRVDTVARLGGDEFAILLDGLGSVNDPIDVAERIQTALSEGFNLNGLEFFTTASMGIAFSSENYDRPEDILRDADTAMYKAKASGKACYKIFDTYMHTRAVEALTLENELRQALEKGQVKPFFQPIIELKTGRYVGFESLARWVHPERGLVSPADFIPLAEETGLIVPLGFSILKQSCEQVVRWQKQFDLPDLTISVNLSGKQIKHTALIQEVKDILFDSGLHPRNLKLEITETIIMDNKSVADEMLKQLKGIGVDISVDDFGTGYSSLSYLHRFPFDIIKIDRSFISRMNSDRQSRGIVKTIATLASELGKEVVSEGIEMEEQVELLNELNCRYGQGYLFSKPVDGKSAGELLQLEAAKKSAQVRNLNNIPIDSPSTEVFYEM